MTQAEHLQSIILLRRRYKCSWCYDDQFTSYSMLCKVILRTVNDSETSHEVLLNRGSIQNERTRATALSPAQMTLADISSSWSKKSTVSMVP